MVWNVHAKQINRENKHIKRDDYTFKNFLNRKANMNEWLNEMMEYKNIMYPEKNHESYERGEMVSPIF